MGRKCYPCCVMLTQQKSFLTLLQEVVFDDAIADGAKQHKIVRKLVCSQLWLLLLDVKDQHTKNCWAGVDSSLDMSSGRWVTLLESVHP